MISNLRFIERDGKKILQYKMDNAVLAAINATAETDWQDVPLCNEDWRKKYPIGSTWLTNSCSPIEIVAHEDYHDYDICIVGRDINTRSLYGYTKDGIAVFSKNNLRERID